MQTEIKIPHVGESIASVQIQEWLKKEGDAVHKDDPIAVIDSDKTTFDLNAPEDGTLTQILHPAGETVGVGTVVARFDTGKAGNAKPRAEQNTVEPQPPAELDSASAPPPGKNKKAKAKDSTPDPNPPPRKSSTPASVPAPAPTQVPGNAVPKPSRVASDNPDQDKPKKHSAEADGEPPDGSVTPGDREEELVPMSLLRRTIARRLVEAQQTAAMLTTFNEVDMSAIRSLREQHQDAFVERYGIKLGLMSFFAKAAIDALKRFPVLNAQIRGDDILYRNYFDLGVAIATERGLVVPVIRSAERLSFADTENAIADFARRAKSGELKPDELADGTFTVTNGGVFGSLFSTPILNPPQSGILGMHAIEDRVVVREGNMVIRPMMYLALTYDHRVVDGREAVLFLVRIKELIETPARMLLEI